MRDLNIAVQLFRLANHPHFDGEKFSGQLLYDSEIKKLLAVILGNGFSAGKFDDLEVDDAAIFETQELPETGKNVNFTFIVTQSSANRFYKDKNEFIKIHTLKKGIMPTWYYIIDDNFYSGDRVKPPYIKKIETICELIVNLSKIAHFHDIKKDNNGTFYRLVFILHSESKSSSIVIETNLSEEIFDDTEINIDLLKSLVNIEARDDIHYIEKTNTFRNTIIEYVSKHGDSFNKIIENWSIISQLYSNNLAAYMSAFSFHKARKEVVDAELEYSEKFSKVISDVANKALAIPISLAASIAIFKLATNADWIITFIGLIVSAVISSAMIVTQKKQLDRIIHAKEILFSQIQSRLQTDTSELKTSFNEAKEKLDDNEDFCRKVLDTLLSLAWMPTCIGIIGIFMKLFPNFG